MAAKVAATGISSCEAEVVHPADVPKARRLAGTTAAAVGFPPDACAELVLVASELATNLVKHAGGGRLIFSTLHEAGRKGLQIESLDHGPGIADLRKSVCDGYSTAGSLGVGLGAVNRLMDELKIRARAKGGMKLVCRKWLRQAVLPLADSPLDFGAASRAKREDNGDDFVIKQWGAHALVGVIDGCGHGSPAHRAARIARHYVEGHFDRPLGEIFSGVELACQGSRGVVMALLRFNWNESEVIAASVGNVEARIFDAGHSLPVRVRRGILGVHAPRPLLTTLPWTRTSVAVLFSDGVSSRWGPEAIASWTGLKADAMAQAVLRAHGKTADDATVLVVKQGTQ